MGIRFTGSLAEAYVIDVATSTKYVMGTLADNGTLLITDVVGSTAMFVQEGFTEDISEMDVAAFKAYHLNVFTSPTSSEEWPHAKVFNSHGVYTIPSQIHTYDQGSHQYLIGKTAQGSQLAAFTSLW